jgi:hypothetical protein
MDPVQEKKTVVPLPGIPDHPGLGQVIIPTEPSRLPDQTDSNGKDLDVFLTSGLSARGQ